MFSRERIKLSPGTYFIWGKKNKSTFWIALLFVIRSRLGHHNKVTVHCKQIILGPIKVRAGRSQWAVHACLSGIDCMRECKSTYYLWDRLQVLSRALTFLRHATRENFKWKRNPIVKFTHTCGSAVAASLSKPDIFDRQQRSGQTLRPPAARSVQRQKRRKMVSTCTFGSSSFTACSHHLSHSLWFDFSWIFLGGGGLQQWDACWWPKMAASF